MKVLLRKNPRSVALVSGDYCLLFKTVRTQNHVNSKPKSIIEFVSLKHLSSQHYYELNMECYGLLGLIHLKGNTFICVITGKQEVGSIRPQERINVIKNVNFICLENDSFEYIETKYNTQALTAEKNIEIYEKEVPYSSLKRLLSSNSFYYSNDFDIITSLQHRESSYLRKEKKFRSILEYSKNFLWNNFMVGELINFKDHLTPQERFLFEERGEFLVCIMRGYVQSVNCSIETNGDSLMTIISKQNCVKTGKGHLFGPWGLDDNGNTSNFVQSTVCLYTKNTIFFYNQIRGNVPLFWSLENQLLSTKIDFPRSSESSQAAFDKYFDILCQNFGNVHVLDGLSERGYQRELTEKYKESFRNLDDVLRQQVTYNEINFPLDSLKNHTADSKLLKAIEDRIIDIGAYCYSLKDQTSIGKQSGIFLTNTFNSLEKANYIQQLISSTVFHACLSDLDLNFSNDIAAKHNELWHENGQRLQKITLHAMSSKHTKNKQGGLVGVVAGVSKKYVSNVVQDNKIKEHNVDKLLGRLNGQIEVQLIDPIHDFVTNELRKKKNEFTSQRTLKIFTGTFNINGELYEGDIRSWIYPLDDSAKENYDVIAIGFQEIISLSAGKMINVDSKNRQFWEKKLLLTVNRDDPNKYTMLWVSQLGGICLFLLVKTTAKTRITDIEGTLKKTGLAGIAANKGAVAISFTYSTTTKFAIVSSHLAAGFHNVVERHQDYKTIAKGMSFARKRTLKDHDIVIWMGDFNYRIELSNEDCKRLIGEKNYRKLYEYDQLNNQMAEGHAFPYYDEMELNFAPTYKFDNGTSRYDTSEKQRVPAWTDRILSISRGKSLNQISYGSVPSIKFSDHRPVYGVFKATVDVIDEEIKNRLTAELYEEMKHKIGDANDILFYGDIINEQDTANMAPSNPGANNYVDNEITLAHGLPPPSSEHTKWWIDGRQSVRVHFPELDDGKMMVNPNLPRNPFQKTKEADFVTIEEGLKEYPSES
ncbi:hypothetical protein LJB42_003740 [Komagataella kurtzmanii]|nr:hypothetical protein LJB42_003740 [Komagataella kurtzmanii]